MSKKFNVICLALEIEEKNTRAIRMLASFQSNAATYIDALIEGDIQRINSSLGEVQQSVVSLNRELTKNERTFTSYNIFNSDFLNDIIQDWIKFTMMYPMFWIHVKNEEYVEAAGCLRNFLQFTL